MIIFVSYFSQNLKFLQKHLHYKIIINFITKIKYNVEAMQIKNQLLHNINNYHQDK